MIDFFSENDFVLEQRDEVVQWISAVISNEGFREGDISFVFCDDDFLLSLNKEYLKHDTLTDIISFDYSMGKQLHGEIYISTERVAENANIFKVAFTEELHRVMIHGILHLCGYKDKSESDKDVMTTMENKALGQRNFG